MIAYSFPFLVIGSMTLFMLVLGAFGIEDAIRHREPRDRRG